MLTAIREAARGRATLHETWSLAELDAVARELARRGARAVVLAGGDGAYMAGITALDRAFGEALPAVALAPGGTVSTVARNWGFKGSMARYAARTVRAVADRSATSTGAATLRVRDASDADRVGFIFGAGLVASFFEVYYAGATLGTAAAARIVARIFAGALVGRGSARRILTPVPASLAVDGAIARPCAWSLIMASVVKDLGLHMHVSYRAGEDPGRIHVVASPLGPRGLVSQLPLVLAGQRLLGRDHVDALARTLDVAFPATGAYVLDGELVRSTRVTVAPGPRLALLRPP